MPVVSKPLCRCAACLEGGEEVVDWSEVRSIEGFTAWQCNRCGRQTPLQNYYWCEDCGLYYSDKDATEHQDHDT
jgi:hypothetical protein